MISKNFPDKLSEDEYNGIVIDYYNRCYGINLSDGLVNAILHPNMK